jgi:glycosyltransferase involved in cell wall biosynthesis
MKTVVTVGMCLRNNEKTVKDAVETVLNQNFDQSKMEIIVVDGNSRDQTISIVNQSLAGSSIKTTFFSENVGLGFARQVVVDNANGEYIIWVDGDILLSQNYLQRQVDFMAKNPTIAGAVGSFGFLENDNWIATLENIGYVINAFKHQGKPTTKIIGTEGAIFRVDALKQIGGFNKKIKGAQEDRDIAYRLKKAGWKFGITYAVFYERQRSTWPELWKQNYWYGYGFHFMQSIHKSRTRYAETEESDDRAILSFLAYKMTRKKVVFLLPLNYVFKKTAFLFGYLMAHFDGYENIWNDI